MSLLKKYRIEHRLSYFDFKNYYYYADGGYYYYTGNIMVPPNLRRREKLVLVRMKISEFVKGVDGAEIGMEARNDGREVEFFYIEEVALKALYMK